ncbi:MAG: magnesium and cobalt transport protein CorA [Marinifilaceae bacterium]
MRRNRNNIDATTPEFTGKRHMEMPEIQLIEFNNEDFYEQKNIDLANFMGFRPGYVSWLNVYGIHDGILIKHICQKLRIHRMIVQDIVDVGQHPKVQFINDYGFFVVKSVIPDRKNLLIEQISFIIHKDYVISFQEREAHFFEHIRERLRKNNDGIREHSADYLLFLFLEAIMFNYQKSVEYIEDQLEDVASFDMDQDPNPEVIRTIEMAKRQIFSLEKLVVPIRDFTTRANGNVEIPFVQDRHIKYFGELRYLAQEINDNCDKLELRLESASNFFFSIQGHRMNQVMKTLTVISVIFIPMTFLTGIYGMNFVFIPGLEDKYSFFIFMGATCTVAISMLVYFKRKHWF